jgi:hypothetical protein
MATTLKTVQATQYHCFWLRRERLKLLPTCYHGYLESWTLSQNGHSPLAKILFPYFITGSCYRFSVYFKKLEWKEKHETLVMNRCEKGSLGKQRM